MTRERETTCIGCCSDLLAKLKSQAEKQEETEKQGSDDEVAVSGDTKVELLEEKEEGSDAGEQVDD